jgi:hypothetical protein
MGAPSPRRAWRLALLLPHPPLSLLYLLAIRSGHLAPAVSVAAGLAIFPLLSLVLGGRRRARETAEEPRRRLEDPLLTALAIVELSWAVLCITIVNIAAVWRLS